MNKTSYGSLASPSVVESAQIDEHDRDQPLAAFETAPHRPVGGAGVGRQERHHREIGDRTNLAGKPHSGRRTDARQRLGLQARRFGKPIEPLGDQDPACRAARPSAADRGVSDAVGAQRFQHGRAGQDRDAAAAGVRQHRRLAAAVVPAPGLPRAANGNSTSASQMPQPIIDHPIDGGSSLPASSWNRPAKRRRNWDRSSPGAEPDCRR